MMELVVLSLRYSSWSMRAWLALAHSGAGFETRTVELPGIGRQQRPGSIDDATDTLASRRALGSVNGLFPVLLVDGTAIHESLAICEYVAELFPDAGLWPRNAVDRALARAVSCEMASGFTHMRGELSSALFARVPGHVPTVETQAEIDRIFELWTDCLQRSGGPFLFGDFTIADAMYFPVLRRFVTYAVPLPASLVPYSDAIHALPAAHRLLEIARVSPPIPIYDDYIRSLGGNPDAGSD